MRNSWTDERLDDFRAETARHLDRLDAKFDKVDERFERLEAKLDTKFEAIDRRFERIDARFDDLFRALIFLGGGVIVTFVVGFAGLIFAG